MKVSSNSKRFVVAAVAGSVAIFALTLPKEVMAQNVECKATGRGATSILRSGYLRYSED